MKKKVMLVLDSQKLELNIPLKRLYNFASDTLKRQRFDSAKKIIADMRAKRVDVKAVALDNKTEEFFERENIPYIGKRDATANLYELKDGEKSYGFLRNLIKTIGEVDGQSIYRGILLPDLDEMNLWRTFAHPAVKLVGVYNELIKKYKPAEAIVLNREHFYQKLFMLAAKNSWIVVTDTSGLLSGIPWKAKQHGMKFFGFLNKPKYLRNLKPHKIRVQKKAKKKILISHNTISAKKIIPWARKLLKNYEVVYVGVKESGEPFERAGIKYLKLQDYATESLLRNIKAQSAVLRKEFSKVFGNPKIRNAMNYQNVDISSALEEMFLYIYYVSSPILLAYVELFSQMIASEKPDLVVTVDEISRFGRTLIRVADANGIKSAVVQHGVLWDHPYYNKTYATKFAAYGEQTKKILLEKRNEFKPGQVAVVGQGEDVPEADANKIRENVCTRLSLPRKNPIVTFAGQALSESVNYPLLEIFYRAAKDFPDVQFVAKLHPDEAGRLHEEFIRKFSLGNVAVAKDIDIKELIIASNVVVHVNSTVGFEAYSLGKPIITICNGFSGKYLPRSAAAFISKNSAQLKKDLSKLLKAPKEKLSKIAAKDSKKYILATGDAACNNIKKLVDVLVKNG